MMTLPRIHMTAIWFAVLVAAAPLTATLSHGDQDPFTIAHAAFVKAKEDVKKAEQKLEAEEKAKDALFEKYDETLGPVTNFDLAIERLWEKRNAALKERQRLRLDLKAKQAHASALRKVWDRIAPQRREIGAKSFRALDKELRDLNAELNREGPRVRKKIEDLYTVITTTRNEIEVLHDQRANAGLHALQSASVALLNAEIRVAFARTDLAGARSKKRDAFKRFQKAMAEASPPYVQGVEVKKNGKRIYRGEWVTPPPKDEKTTKTESPPPGGRPKPVDEKTTDVIVAGLNRQIAELQPVLKKLRETETGLKSRRDEFLEAIKKNRLEYNAALADMHDQYVNKLIVQTTVDIGVVLMEAALTGGAATILHQGIDWTTSAALKLARRRASKIATDAVVGRAFRKTARSGIKAMSNRAIASNKAWQSNARAFMVENAIAYEKSLIKGLNKTNPEHYVRMLKQAEERAVKRFNGTIGDYAKKAQAESLAAFREQAMEWAQNERNLLAIARPFYNGSQKRLADLALISARRSIAARAATYSVDQGAGGINSPLGQASLGLLGDTVEGAFDRGVRSGTKVLSDRISPVSRVQRILGPFKYQELGQWRKITPTDFTGAAGAAIKFIGTHYYAKAEQRAKRKWLRKQAEGSAIYAGFRINQFLRASVNAAISELAIREAFLLGRREGFKAKQKLSVSVDETIKEFPATLEITLKFSNYVAAAPIVRIGGIEATVTTSAGAAGADTWTARVTVPKPPANANEIEITVNAKGFHDLVIDSDPSTPPLAKYSEAKWEHYEPGDDKHHALSIKPTRVILKATLGKTTAEKEIR